jgi:hypothetical protein
LLTAGIYRFLIRTYSPGSGPWAALWSQGGEGSIASLPLKFATLNSDTKWRVLKAVGEDVVSGISIVCIIGVSFLVVISFADFLRLNWHTEPGAHPRRRRPRRPRPARHVAPGAAAAAAVAAAGAPAAPPVAPPAAAPVAPPAAEQGDIVHQDLGVAAAAVPVEEGAHDGGGDDGNNDNDGNNDIDNSDDEDDAAAARAMNVLAAMGVDIDVLDVDDEGEGEGEGEEEVEVEDNWEDVHSDEERDGEGGEQADAGGIAREDLARREAAAARVDAPHAPLNPGGGGGRGGGQRAQELEAERAAEHAVGGAEIFFDDDGALDDLERIAAQDAAMDAVEIRIALNDILGFRGSVVILLRSTVFLFVFNVCYIWTFGYIPLRIGNLYHTFFGDAPVAFLKNIYQYFPEIVTGFAGEFFDVSEKSNKLLAINEVLVILMGYVTICVAVFVLATCAFVIHVKMFTFPTNVTPKVVKLGLSVVGITSSILKVGTLLFLRIFWLPLIIGCMSLYCTNVIFEFTQTEYVNFIVSNMVGFVSLAWVAGISFMLAVTLSVLQLREVLHPDMLARRVRPQEAHLELLNSLVNDNGLVHTRRVVSSVLIYSGLLVLFLWLPVYLLRAVVGTSFDIHVYYFCPNLQLPFEMAMVHFVFLSILEKHKDLIGSFQYNWLVYACDKLSLTSYLLPVHRQHPRITVDGAAASDTPPSSLQVVQRPPPGWDGRSKNDGTSRWAFDEDAVQSDVEKSLMPRHSPPLCYLRMALLAATTWALVMGGVLLALVCLMGTGRLVVGVLLTALPPRLGVTLHDPLCVLIGAHMLLSLYRSCRRFALVLRHGNILFNRIPIRGHLFWMRYAALGFVVIPFSIGFVIRRATYGYDYSASDMSVILKHDFMLGSVLFHSFVHFVVEGLLFEIMDRYFGTHLVEEYNRAVAIACLLFVTDAGLPSGLVINSGQRGENMPIPKALFVPPYSVHEVQAMRLWDHLDKAHTRPFLRNLTGAVLAVLFSHACVLLMPSLNIELPVQEVSVVHFLTILV